MTEIKNAMPQEYELVRSFYHSLIDALVGSEYGAGWEKDIYPSPEFLKESIDKQELYIVLEDDQIAGAMVVNHEWNEGYDQYEWPTVCKREEVVVIHALGVHGAFTGKGYGRKMVEYTIRKAEKEGLKAIRLDVLKGNLPAEKLYTGLGFKYQHTLTMYYEDTGWTDYELYEYKV